MTQIIIRNNQAQKQCMRKSDLNYLKRTNGKKKKGFTLIEVIAVIAIIGMMASILLPKFTNYMNEAKKLKVVEQSRKIVMAVEAYNMKAETQIEKESTVGNAMSTFGVSKYFENGMDDIDKLPRDMSVEDCYNVVSGKEFSINPETEEFGEIEEKTK